MYTDDKNAQVVLSLLKQYGIKKIVVSPGTTNVPISRSVQLDPWFEVYSIVDERSAAYFATGLSYSSGEPVAISCTGATASRNYLPGLTEAYYRNLPIIALTSQHHTSDFGNLSPQVTDRTVSQNDIKKLSVHLPVVKDAEDYERCVLSVNKALIAATTNGNGPVHINLQVVGDYSFTTAEIPVARRIRYVDSDEIVLRAQELARELNGRKVAIFIGSHRKFSEREKDSLERFSRALGAPVLVDQTSGYRGKQSILVSQIADLRRSQNKPDIIIDMGSITGDYTVAWLQGIEAWRISEDGQIHDRFSKQTLLFDGPEHLFFDALAGHVKSDDKNSFSEQLINEISRLITPDDLPLSNTYVSQGLSRQIPKGSNLHLGILNSLRNMNFFMLDESIDSTSNVGGFGIDGALSTAVGQSMVDRTSLTYCLVGDLAAFYDMNALGIRHIGSNLRIIMVNNNGGVEFRLNPSLETQWSNDTDEFISAGGHFGSIKGWAESMNFHYMKASTKEEFDVLLPRFCSKDIDEFGGPVLFEVFTTIPDEQRGVAAVQDANKPEVEKVEGLDREGEIRTRRSHLKGIVKQVAPEKAKKLYRKLRSRG